MRRTFRKIIQISAFSIMAVCFLSCSHFLLDDGSTQKAHVSIGNINRSIEPVFTVEEITDVKLFATKVGTADKKEIASWATYAQATAVEEKVEVEQGNFDFELTAKKGGITLSDTLENVSISKGNNPLSFTLDIAGAEGNGTVTLTLSFPKKMVGKASATLYSDNACTKAITGTEKTIIPEETTLTYSVSEVPAGTCYAKFSFWSDPDGTVPCKKEYISDSILAAGDLESKNVTPIQIDKSFLESDPWVLVTVDGQEKPFVYKMPAPLFTNNVYSDICSELAVEGISGISRSDFTAIEFHNIEGVGKNSCDSWDKLSSVLVASCFDTFTIDAFSFSDSGSDDGSGNPTAMTFESNVDVSVGLGAFSGSSLTTFPFERTVMIGKFAFSDTQLQEVDLSDSLITSLENAFSNCLELETVKLPSVIKQLEYAFVGCEKIETIELPEGLVNIKGALKDCIALKSVVVPSSVRNMEWAFEDCPSLTSAYVKTQEISSSNSAFGNPTSSAEFYNPSLAIYIPQGSTSYFSSLGGSWEGYTLVEDIDYSAARVGDIILADGTLRTPDEFVAGTDTAAAIVVRAKSDDSPVLGMGVQFGTDMLWCVETADGYRTEITSLAGTEASGLTNGSSGLKRLKSFVSDWSTPGNYPAWEYCANYGSNNSLTENMATGWYLPAFVELVDIYWEKDIINATLEKLNIDTIGTGGDYGEFWSCNQVADGDTPSWYAYVLDMGIYDEEVIVALPDYFKIYQCNVLALHAF